MIQIEIDKFKIKITNDDNIQVFPLNIIGYLINKESEIVTFYDSYNKMIVLNTLFSDLVINTMQANRINIDELLKDLFFINYYTKEEADELLDKKADKSDTYTKNEVDDKLDTKVDKEARKGLSSNDYTDDEKIKLAGLFNYDDGDIVDFINDKQDKLFSGSNIKTINGNSLLGSGNIVIEGGSGGTIDAYTKLESDNLLSSKVSVVELVHDAVDSLHYTLMVDSVNKGEINIPKDQFLKSASYDSVTKELVFIFNIESGESITKINVTDLVDEYTAGNGLDIVSNMFFIDEGVVATNTSVDTKLSTKVDKEAGKELSSNDYTDDEKTKLSSLTNYDDSVVRGLIDSKQDKLVSGSNIKTINGNDILGSGDIVIEVDTSDKVAKSGDTITGVLNIESTLNIGSGNTVTGEFAMSQGSRCTASGKYSHAEGERCKASGDYSHSEGSYTTANGWGSHAEGKATIVSGYASHAEGSNTNASGYCSHAEGYGTTASGKYSHAEGNMTIANNNAEHSSGSYNVSISGVSQNDSNLTNDNQATLFSIGNGTSTSNRKNAFEVKWNGDIYINKENEVVKLQDLLEKSTLVEVIPSGSTLTLTSDKIQYSTITANTSVILPTLTDYSEIHLIFSGSSTSTLAFDNTILWKEKIGVMKNSEVYELVFTYINKINKWIAGYIKYE